MRKSRFTESQIIGILKKAEGGAKVLDLAREHGVSTATIYSWRAKFGGMDVSEAKRLRELEDENRRLKQIVADLSLDKEALKLALGKSGKPCREPRRSEVPPQGLRSQRTPSMQVGGAAQIDRAASKPKARDPWARGTPVGARSRASPVRIQALDHVTSSGRIPCEPQADLPPVQGAWTDRSPQAAKSSLSGTASSVAGSSFAERMLVYGLPQRFSCRWPSPTGLCCRRRLFTPLRRYGIRLGAASWPGHACSR